MPRLLVDGTGRAAGRSLLSDPRLSDTHLSRAEIKPLRLDESTWGTRCQNRVIRRKFPVVPKLLHEDPERLLSRPDLFATSHTLLHPSTHASILEQSLDFVVLAEGV